LLVPVAIWILGIPFEGRRTLNHPLAGMSVLALYEPALLGLLVADIALAMWLVWFSRGFRPQMVLAVTFQFLLCCFVVYFDLFWAAGPP
jgi:hypothetical protein